jgi:hypothetical protein
VAEPSYEPSRERAVRKDRPQAAHSRGSQLVCHSTEEWIKARYDFRGGLMAPGGAGSQVWPELLCRECAQNHQILSRYAETKYVDDDRISLCRKSAETNANQQAYCVSTVLAALSDIAGII